VNKILGHYVQHARRPLTEGRVPVPESAFAHLTEMVVRIALRESWDLCNAKMAAQRIYQMMFDPTSELHQVAMCSELVFIAEQQSHDQLLTINDILEQVHSKASALDEFAQVDVVSYGERRKYCIKMLLL